MIGNRDMVEGLHLRLTCAICGTVFLRAQWFEDSFSPHEPEPPCCFDCFVEKISAVKQWAMYVGRIDIVKHRIVCAVLPANSRFWASRFSDGRLASIPVDEFEKTIGIAPLSRDAAA